MDERLQQKVNVTGDFVFLDPCSGISCRLTRCQELETGESRSFLLVKRGPHGLARISRICVGDGTDGGIGRGG